MWKQCLAGSTALALILVGAGRAAEEATATKTFQIGPMQVELQVSTAAEPAGPGKASSPSATIQIDSADGAAGGVIVSGSGGAAQAGGPIGITLAGVTIGEYWLGVECRPADAAMRVQLGLAEDEGLVVASVVPDSPAAKAGLREHDVLLKVGDNRLAKVQELIQAVDAAKDQKLTLELIRGGKKRSLEVQPAKRPEDAKGLAVQWPEDKDSQAVQRWMERMFPGEGGRWPMRFQFVHPGTILPPGAPAHLPLPGDLTVVITRHGADPAKIVVERGKERWEVTEKDLDKLPADVRPHVERMLGHGAFGPAGFGRTGEWPQPKVEGPPAPAGESRLEKRMEEMGRRLEKMEKAIQDFRENRPRKSAPGEKPNKI